MTQQPTSLHGKKLVLEFAAPTGVSLAGLCAEPLSYTKPSAKNPFATKVLGDGSAIKVQNDKSAKKVVVEYDGDVSDWGQARFVVDNIYSDLALIGVVAPIEA